MAVTDYINLRVKRFNAHSSNCGYQFRLDSYDNNTKNLSNYAVRLYIYGHFSRNNWALSDTMGGQAGGGAPFVQPNLTITANYFDLQSGNPPRVGTTSINPNPGLFTVRFHCRFTTGTLDAVGEYYENMTFNIRSTAYKSFERYISGGSQFDYDDSYSKETSTSYSDNSTFVLVYNDIDPSNPNSSNWQVVNEVIDNSGTPDPNTGNYPYGPVDVDNTSLDHTMKLASADSHIHDGSASSNYGTSSNLLIDRGTPTSNRRALIQFDTSVEVGATHSVDAAYVFSGVTTLGNQGPFEINEITTHGFEESEVTWNEYSTGNSWSTAGADFSLLETFNPTSSPRSGALDAYPGNHLVIDVQSVVNARKGIDGLTELLLKYQNENAGFNQGFFQLGAKENGTTALRPYIVVAGVAATSSSRRVFIVQ